MMRRATAVCVALSVAGAAWAGPQREAVLDVLSGVETPPTHADLQAIGEGVTSELLDIAADVSVPASRRGRAITALGFYPTDAVRAFLEAQLREADTSLYRRKAVGALATGWGAEALPLLKEALDDADVQLRIATVGALAELDDGAGIEVLQQRLVAEPDLHVKDAITKALKAEVTE